MGTAEDLSLVLGLRTKIWIAVDQTKPDANWPDITGAQLRAILRLRLDDLDDISSEDMLLD